MIEGRGNAAELTAVTGDHRAHKAQLQPITVECHRAACRSRCSWSPAFPAQLVKVAEAGSTGIYGRVDDSLPLRRRRRWIGQRPIAVIAPGQRHSRQRYNE